MVMGREQVLAEIESAWEELRAVIDEVPSDRMESAQVVETWSVKDLLGHITTWEAEAIGNIERFLDPQTGAMRRYPDVDEFNQRTTEEKRAVPLADMRRDLAETHARLVRFLRDLPETAFHREEVARRIRLDTYEHYREHAETIRDWLGSPGA